MKITRRQLRRLIEAFEIKLPVFDKVTSKEIDDLRAIAREKAGVDAMIGPEKVGKLKKLATTPTGKDQAQSIYQTFGSEEPDFTSSQEEEYIKGQEDYEQKLHDGNYLQIAKMILNGGQIMMQGIDLALQYNIFSQQRKLYGGEDQMDAEYGTSAKVDIVFRMHILNDKFADIFKKQLVSDTNSDITRNQPPHKFQSGRGFNIDYPDKFSKPVLDNEDYDNIYYDLFISSRNARPRYQRFLMISVGGDGPILNKMLNDFNRLVDSYPQRSFGDSTW